MNARQIILTAGLICLVVGQIASDGQAVAPAKLALQGGRIIPVDGPEIANGTLLIEHGKIRALGTDVTIPYDAMVVDVSGKVLFPGTISPHTWLGLDRANENLPVAPYLDVYDAIDPSSLFFETALRDGVLGIHTIQGNSCVIGGLSRLVQPIGMTPDEMTIRPSIALKLSTTPKSGYDRMSQMAAMREAFLELDDYLQKRAEQRYEEEQKKKGEDVTVAPDEARRLGRELIADEYLDDKHRNLVKLTDGRLAAWIYCGAATDVGPAIRTAKENGFLDRTIFVLGGDAHRAVDELKKAARPVVLSAELVYRRRGPITGKIHETFIPSVIYKAGLLFALQPNGSESMAERLPTYQAARCVRHGIPRDVALRAITVNPAEMLDVDDQLGSLAVGKRANLVVLGGDPLDFNTWVEKAYIDGILAYDRTKDVRLKELLGVEQKLDEVKKAEGNKTGADQAGAEKPDANKLDANKEHAEKPEPDGKDDDKDDDGKDDDDKDDDDKGLHEEAPAGEDR